MTKYIIGAVAGAVLMVGVYAGAQSKTGLTVVDGIKIHRGAVVQKIYDASANVVCYSLQDDAMGYNFGSISCLKNN